MYNHILIPTDGSEPSEKAVRGGVDLAKLCGATITFVTVLGPSHALPEEPRMVVKSRDGDGDQVQDYLSARADARLAVAESIAQERDVTCQTVALEHDHAYQGILDTATERGCDLIVMASHGLSGTSETMLGSETLKVLTHSNMPVVIYR